LQRGQIYQVSKIDSSIVPPLFYLKDLQGDAKTGRYYEKQLFKAPDPTDKNFSFEVEEELATKKVNGVKYTFCKFLYYPNKFNMWIPKANFTK